ncbi:non-heme iron oxygenase ferredoxin subunit [Mycobacterium sp.]|uniref:non-heme iron oxygenase ferredoxin subunit n=1 Tax=Mycobacterium sp. TaxID=1785 RepID=UPI003D10468D
MSLTFAFTVNDLADGEARPMPAAPHVAVYRVGDDFYATQDSCSHEEWSLGDDGELEGHEVVCSLHMARFDVRDGRALCLPALKALTTYPVSVIDGRVLVDVDGHGVAPTDNTAANGNRSG